MWRHTANAFLFVLPRESDFGILGPLRGGGELVELGFISQTAGSMMCRYAAALTGSPSPTIENLRSGTSLIQRSSDTAGYFRVPTATMALVAAEHCRQVVPLSVRMDAGSHFVIVGIRVEQDEEPVDSLLWALVVGGKV